MNFLQEMQASPTNAEMYGKGLWSHILDDQLHVTEEEFWDCVDSATGPIRVGGPETATSSLSAALAYQLVNSLKLSAEEISALSLEETTKLMADFWSQPSS